MLVCNAYLFPYSSESAEPDYLPLVRPIFDWSEVGDHFPQASPTMDYSLLAQVHYTITSLYNLFYM